MNKYDYREYDPIFPELFQQEKNRLEQFLAIEHNIEHIGSTAVPGLGGKGIIDIHVMVPVDQIYLAFNQILKAGYIFGPSPSIDWAFYFNIVQPDSIEGERNYHLHLSEIGNENFERIRKFRDHLRSNLEDRERYALAKKQASLKSGNERKVYVALKEPIIKEILAKL